LKRRRRRILDVRTSAHPQPVIEDEPAGSHLSDAHRFQRRQRTLKQ